MNKRPKSREETPKEGSDSAKHYRTAPICDRAAQKARVFDSLAVQSCWGWRFGKTSETANLILLYQILKKVPGQAPAVSQLWYDKTRNFVIGAVDRKFTNPQF
jgi:hypothetical protein